MKLLEEKILAEGHALNESILKVDSFINHQVDPQLMYEMGKDIADHFRGQGVTKVFTIESSGIAPAVYAAQELGVPMVILKKQVSKKMFPGYVLIHMIMNDDTWYVVRNTRGVTGFVGPGSKPVPLTDAEMRPLGIKAENVVVDFAEGDMIVVIGGVWKDTCGVITAMNHNKQTVTINVDLFGRETPVEVSFADVKKMN